MNAATFVAAAAIVIAVIAYAYARGTARKLAMLEEMYWQLKFEHGELKAKLDHAPPSTPEPKQTFVPLIRLRPDANKPAPGHGETGSTEE